MVEGLKRGSVWRSPSGLLLCVLLLAALLGGCGVQQTAEPLSPDSLLADMSATTAASHFDYSSVLVTSGQGAHRFLRGRWPRHIALEMSCRGGRSVTATVGGISITVFCAAGQAGGGTKTIGRASALTVSAGPGTRWSLIVASGRGGLDGRR